MKEFEKLDVLCSSLFLFLCPVLWDKRWFDDLCLDRFVSYDDIKEAA